MATAAERQFDHLKAQGRTEQVTYRPDGGDAREITALVDREPRDETLNASVPVIRLTVLNDATKGITPAELDLGADRISVAEKIGGTAISRNISQIAAQDAEFLTIEVR